MVSKNFKRRGPTAPTAKACASMFLLLLVFGPGTAAADTVGSPGTPLGGIEDLRVLGSPPFVSPTLTDSNVMNTE